MIRYSSEVLIDRPPSDVFAALLDIERYPDWTPMRDARWETSGAPAVGTRGSFRMAEGPFKGTLRTEIVELVPDRRVVFAVEHPGLRWKSESNLAPAGAGTRLTYGGELTLRGWRRLLEPLMAGEVRRGEAKEAEQLKGLLERRGSEAAPAASTA